MKKFVGVTGFEPATSRPPDERANRAALYPEYWMAKINIITPALQTLLSQNAFFTPSSHLASHPTKKELRKIKSTLDH